MRKILGKLKSLILKTIAMIIGCIFYNPKYFGKKYFHKYNYSYGWQAVMKNVFMQKIIGINRQVPWPVDFRVVVCNHNNIEFDPDNITIFQKPGNYYNPGNAKIKFGKDLFIACNVGIIAADHDPYDLSKHLPGKDIVIEDNCWIGINSTILKGVHLGERTIVGAGSVVTKSFPEGNCIIAGNPAKIIKKL